MLSGVDVLPSSPFHALRYGIVSRKTDFFHPTVFHDASQQTAARPSRSNGAEPNGWRRRQRSPRGLSPNMVTTKRGNRWSRTAARETSSSPTDQEMAPARKGRVADATKQGRGDTASPTDGGDYGEYPQGHRQRKGRQREASGRAGRPRHLGGACGFPMLQRQRRTIQLPPTTMRPAGGGGLGEKRGGQQRAELARGGTHAQMNRPYRHFCKEFLLNEFHRSLLPFFRNNLAKMHNYSENQRILFLHPT